jgi:hypothetical protein
MPSIQRPGSVSPREDIRLNKRARVAKKLNDLPPIQYKGRSQGFLGLFRACKKIKAKRNGRDFQEEYLLLRKRARSNESKKIHGNKTPTMSQIQSYRDEFDLKKTGADAEQAFLDMDEKLKTVRAKSIESKRKKLLAESIRFQ